MKAIPEARPLEDSTRLSIRMSARRTGTAYLETTSPNIATDMNVWIVPLTAEDTICVTGEVILIEMKPAKQIRKPNTPFKNASVKMSSSLGKINTHSNCSSDHKSLQILPAE